MPLLVGTRRALLGGGALSVPRQLALTTRQFSATTTATGDLPGTIPTGLLLVAFVATTGAPTFTGPSGWTLLRTTNVGSSRALSVWQRVANGSEAATYDWTIGSSQTGVVAIAAYDGTAIEAENSAFSAGASAADAPSLVASGTGRLLVAAWVANAAFTVTTPASMYERSTTANGVRLAIADESLAAAGATGVRTATISTSSGYVGQSLLVSR